MTELKSTFMEHAASLLLVGALVALFILSVRPAVSPAPAPGTMDAFLMSDSLDLTSPVQRAFFKDAFRELTGGTTEEADSLLRAAEERRRAEFADREAKAGGARRMLDAATVMDLLPMFARFLLMFAAVLCSSYLLARVVALYRFASGQNGQGSSLRRYGEIVRVGGVRAALSRIDLPLRACASGVLTLLLFCPAYVVAYAFRTRLETDNTLFAFLLAMFSNGLLVNYANRFHALLVTESRKGYVETARVKGLAHSYRFDRKDGLSVLSLLRPSALASHHVLGHIYLNARFQFMTTLKEHAAYLVTGLVVIELALNIKGDLCYALLQHMLYREYDIVAFILLLIFFMVKLTEALVDFRHAAEARKYDNAD
jgi:hypothetical protein